MASVFLSLLNVSLLPPLQSLPYKFTPAMLALQLIVAVIYVVIELVRQNNLALESDTAMTAIGAISVGGTSGANGITAVGGFSVLDDDTGGIIAGDLFNGVSLAVISKGI